jgi:hypothetical protein
LDTLPTNLPAIAFGRRLDTYFLQAGGGLAKLGGVASLAGVTDLLVARLIQNFFLTQVDVWVNTNDFTLPPLLSTTVPSLAYNWVNLEVQPGLFADEVRVGTTSDSVAAPVPEPETGALMAAGLLALGFASNRRNRRR